MTLHAAAFEALLSLAVRLAIITAILSGACARAPPGLEMHPQPTSLAGGRVSGIRCCHCAGGLILGWRQVQKSVMFLYSYIPYRLKDIAAA